MDKQTLYDKAEKAINHAFEAAQQSVKVVSQKAGETAHITKLMIEKVALEHKVSKQFAKLGGHFYERVTREGKTLSSSDKDIQAYLEEAKKLDVELARIEAELKQELNQKAPAAVKK